MKCWKQKDCKNKLSENYIFNIQKTNSMFVTASHIIFHESQNLFPIFCYANKDIGSFFLLIASGMTK